MRPVVGLVETLPEEQMAALRTGLPAGTEVIDTSSDPSSIGRAVYLVLREGTVDETLLRAAPALRCVVRMDLGGATLDEEACARQGIRVVVIASPSLVSVAEHTVMLVLMLLKRFKEATERLRAGTSVGGMEPTLTTQERYAYNWVGLERFEALRRKRVGLVGLGRIGSENARLLGCFGADVVYTKRHRLSAEEEQALHVRFLSFDELLRTADVVSLHNRFTPETERMMGEREFGLMRSGAFFINTARGRLVDENALARALESGHLGGAALDVFWMEPLPKESPLLSAPNLLLTPHTAGIPTAESERIELEEAGLAIASDAAGVL